MDRINFLMKALEVNDVQALLVSELIKEVPNDKLKDFLVFRMNYIDKFKSKELITKEALFDYQRISIESRLRAGEKIFATVADVKNHIERFYKNKDLANGVASFYDYVVIALNADCELVNKFSTNLNGTFKKLHSIDSAKVYEWFFNNQHRLGDVNIVAVYETASKLLEAPKAHDDAIDVKVLGKINNIKKVV